MAVSLGLFGCFNILAIPSLYLGSYFTSDGDSNMAMLDFVTFAAAAVLVSSATLLR